MPNMFGGDQFHPAYDCETKINENQVLIHNTLYTALPNGMARWEDVDGSSGVCSMPPELKEKLTRKGK